VNRLEEDKGAVGIRQNEMKREGQRRVGGSGDSNTSKGGNGLIVHKWGVFCGGWLMETIHYGARKAQKTLNQYKKKQKNRHGGKKWSS